MYRDFNANETNTFHGLLIVFLFNLNSPDAQRVGDFQVCPLSVSCYLYKRLHLPKDS
nr:MAG TPA: hypothetical protein [Herelleviridae sp.]